MPKDWDPRLLPLFSKQLTLFPTSCSRHLTQNPRPRVLTRQTRPKAFSFLLICSPSLSTTTWVRVYATSAHMNVIVGGQHLQPPSPLIRYLKETHTAPRWVELSWPAAFFYNVNNCHESKSLTSSNSLPSKTICWRASPMRKPDRIPNYTNSRHLTPDPFLSFIASSAVTANDVAINSSPPPTFDTPPQILSTRSSTAWTHHHQGQDPTAAVTVAIFLDVAKLPDELPPSLFVSSIVR